MPVSCCKLEFVNRHAVVRKIISMENKNQMKYEIQKIKTLIQ